MLSLAPLTSLRAPSLDLSRAPRSLFLLSFLARLHSARLSGSRASTRSRSSRTLSRSLALLSRSLASRSRDARSRGRFLASLSFCALSLFSRCARSLGSLLSLAGFVVDLRPLARRLLSALAFSLARSSLLSLSLALALSLSLSLSPALSRCSPLATLALARSR
ncbi:hypothetical protein Tco_1311781 [Tanacetum coccineum]